MIDEHATPSHAQGAEAEGADPWGHRPIPDRLIVKFRDTDTPAAVGERAQRGQGRGWPRGLRKVQELTEDGATQVYEAEPGRGRALRAVIARLPDVEFVENDVEAPPAFVPNDPQVANQWYLTNIQAPAAWDRVRGAPGVILAVIDSGVDPAHPDLAPALVPGWNFRYNSADTADRYGHGTRVAGCAAAVLGNGVGIAGVAGGIRIMPMGVADHTSGYGSLTAMVYSLDWARQRGARLANLSFGGMAKYAALRDAGKRFQAAGGLVFAAAGNTGALESIADNPGLVSIAATDKNNVKASWSTYGPFVNLAAPGVGILSTAKGGGYAAVSGTSFASPIAAACAALVMSAKPGITPAGVMAALVESAKDLGAKGADPLYGMGLVQAYGAVTIVVPLGPPPPPPPPPPPTPDTTAPTVAITKPVNGAIVRRTVPITVVVSDVVGIQGQRLLVDGVPLPAGATSWDSTFTPDGARVTLRAEAWDAAGNRGAAEIQLIIQNRVAATLTVPTSAVLVQDTAPASGETVLRVTTYPYTDLTVLRV